MGEGSRRVGCRTQAEKRKFGEDLIGTFLPVADFVNRTQVATRIELEHRKLILNGLETHGSQVDSFVAKRRRRRCFPVCHVNYSSAVAW